MATEGGQVARCGVETPFGPLTLVAEASEIVGLSWGRTAARDRSELLETAVRQLEAYCAGSLHSFDLPLRMGASEFQQAVGAAMLVIPFGQTRTYGDIARDLGVPAQAIGQACGANPVPIIIPCHRVMGAKGMTGFSGGTGVETKVALLRHEGSVLL